ncbi:MAG: hypothetical protein OHK0046_20760 [Anaerolineae bacterium]
MALKPYVFDTIYHSTMNRAVQTARIIAQALPEADLHPTPLLRECVPSLPVRLAQAYAVSKGRPQPTVVNTQRCLQRLESAFDEHFLPAIPDEDLSAPTVARDLLVCHGNIIRYFVTRVLQADPALWVNMAVHNCGITIVHIQESGQMTLISHNDTGHLPDTLRTQG